MKCFPARGSAVVLALGALLAGPLFATSAHPLSGRVVDGQGRPVGGVEVIVSGQRTRTDAEGRFHFESVAAGLHRLEVRSGELRSEREVRVPWTGGELVQTVDWPLVFQETLTVYAASKRRERLVEAPAAITSLLPTELAAQTSAGQLPRLVNYTPGVQVAQSDLYDFNLNTRGFNSAINRRVLTLIDGRQTSVPEFLGVQEWGSLSMPLDEFDTVELVRGPSSALYGAGAVSGVLNIVTKSSRDTLGVKARISAGELDTARFEGRVAGALGPVWSWRVAASVQQSDHLTESRVESVEYEPVALPRELVAPPFDRLRTDFFALRFDRFGDESALAIEAGTGSFEGGTTLAPLGRTQAESVRRPWARVNWNRPQWNLLAFYSGRDGDNQVGLSTGAALFSEGYNLGIELQGNREVAGGRGLLVGGLSAARQRIDSSDPNGVHGIFAGVVSAEQTAAFGQLRFDLAADLALVASARLDDSSLHGSRLSPRLGVTWAVGSRHSLRATVNESYQSPTLVEFAVRTPVGPTLDLSAIPLGLADRLGGETLGFDRVPQLALGNEGLEVEEIRSYELGYRGASGSTFVAASVYRDELTNFTTSILPQVGTSLGRLNPDFGPYRPPAELSLDAASRLLAALEAALPPPLFALLSNDADGSPILAVLSVTNFGEAVAEGLEVEISHFFSPAWQLSVSAASARYEVVDSPPENPLLPNAPELQAAASLVGTPAPWSTALRLRWVEDFEWSSGLFRGPVPEYLVADLHVAYDLTDKLRIGVDVANLSDNSHYELFGGNLLGRRALLHLTYWRR